MNDLKKAKENAAKMKSKWTAAKKRLKTAERNGSEKQIVLATKHVKMWKNRYLRAEVVVNRLKESAPTLKERIKQTPMKKVATFSGLALAVVATVIIGGIVIDKSRTGDGEGQPATDSV